MGDHLGTFEVFDVAGRQQEPPRPELADPIVCVAFNGERSVLVADQTGKVQTVRIQGAA